MSFSTSDALDVLATYDIYPLENEDVDPPEIGEIHESEKVYETSIASVFGDDFGTVDDPDIFEIDDRRILEWWSHVEQIVEDPSGELARRRRERPQTPPEPHCAWYCPIHFFGHAWGIYIRESCILSHAIDIALFVDWRAVPNPFARRAAIARQLLRSAFYAFFLHEQFHHKVESLGFRILIATGTDRYRPYKRNVYRRTYLTRDCLEESLANAESYRRLDESRYAKRLDPAILEGMRRYLKFSIPMQPPGYAQGMNYLSKASYRNGLFRLQSQILDGLILPTTPAGHWSMAPDMITALANITKKIYVVLPQNAQPIFHPTWVTPGATVSSRALIDALTRHHGYLQASGGKGSHVKLTKLGSPQIVVPGNRAVLSPGVVKHALNAIGGYPISKLPDLLEGGLITSTR